jgi:hypothetical protein
MDRRRERDGYIDRPILEMIRDIFHEFVRENQFAFHSRSSLISTFPFIVYVL